MPAFGHFANRSKDPKRAHLGQGSSHRKCFQPQISNGQDSIDKAVDFVLPYFGAAVLTFSAEKVGVIGAAHAEIKSVPPVMIKPGSALAGRQLALYFSWSRPDEIAAPLGILEDRFPALFELRRLVWPRLEHFADPVKYDQSVGGFLDNIQLANFRQFCKLTAAWTGNAVRCAERKTEVNQCALDGEFLSGVDTLVIISLDSSRTKQQASDTEIAAVRTFLEDPDHTLFVCLHHDIGNIEELPENERSTRQLIEFCHHGDTAIPAKQSFSGFGISLLNSIGLTVRNRFGLHPAKLSDGLPAPLEIANELDRFGLLAGVTTFNLHPHLPHIERLGDATAKLDVIVRQTIDPDAPPHPYTAKGQHTFDALLQAKSNVFAGRLLICDVTTWSSTMGGLDSLQRFWRNVALLSRTVSSSR